MCYLPFILCCVFLGALPLAASNPVPDMPQAATVSINADVQLRRIPSAMYGTNVEWIWDSYGLWNEAARQVNPTILKLTKDIGVTVIRFPGGQFADFYHWKDGVGPRAQRPPALHHLASGDKSRPNFGTDEALAFAAEVGAELLITVNAGTGTAQEAADWVRYVNARRLRVRYWEVGNELYINDGSVDSRAITVDPQTYARRFLEFAKAMRAVDPRIKIGAIGGKNFGRYNVVSYPDWNRTVLTIAGSQIDFLAVHNSYAPVLVDDSMDARTVYRAMFAAPALLASNLASIAQEIATYAPAKAATLPIAVTEWGPFFQGSTAGKFVDHTKTLGSAIYAASVFKTFLESSATQMANFHTLHDLSIMGWIGNTDGRFPPDPKWTPTPRYNAFRLFRRHFGETLVQTSCSSPSFDTPAVGWVDAVPQVPYLDCLASLSADGKSLYLIAINKSFDNSMDTDIQIAGFVPTASATTWTLTGDAIDAHNGTVPLQLPGVTWARQTEDWVNPGFSSGTVSFTGATSPAGQRFTYRFPPRSVTSLQFTRK
ncbi:MAG: hypothetical protein SFV54_04140 [Bryobacteraceae bacterium]|nr:hypothetical protein [Bryobacteraceae bacterium]